MPTPKKITTTLKVFIFLALTLGILWIALAVQKNVSEGFQTFGCETQTIAGRRTYLCPTEAAAQSLYVDSGTTLNPTDAVCYTDTNTLDPSMTSGGSRYYVCYTRPAPQMFDSIFGVYRDVDVLQDEDRAPESEYGGIGLMQNAYSGGYKQMFKSYVNVSTLQGSVDGYGLSNVKYGLTTLNGVKAALCQTDILRATNSNICTSAQAGIDAFTGILNSSNELSLSNLSTILNNSRNKISSVVFNTLEPAFYDAGVMPQEDINRYLSARR